MTHAFVSVAKNEGFLALWKGNNVGCLRLGPYSGTKFMVYDKLKLTVYNDELNTLRRLTVGSIAGIVATLTTYP
eukprot:Awhi_evm1s12287